MTRFIPVLASLLALTAAVHAQSDYPNKPIRLVVPYVAGGAADITARVIGQRMSESMGQTVIIDNKPGANGMLGTDLVAKAAPDGYTLLLTASSWWSSRPLFRA